MRIPDMAGKKLKTRGKGDGSMRRDTAIRDQSLYESLYSPYNRAAEAFDTAIPRLTAR